MLSVAEQSRAGSQGDLEAASVAGAIRKLCLLAQAALAVLAVASVVAEEASRAAAEASKVAAAVVASVVALVAAEEASEVVIVTLEVLVVIATLVVLAAIAATVVTETGSPPETRHPALVALTDETVTATVDLTAVAAWTTGVVEETGIATTATAIVTVTITTEATDHPVTAVDSAIAMVAVVPAATTNQFVPARVVGIANGRTETLTALGMMTTGSEDTTAAATRTLGKFADTKPRQIPMQTVPIRRGIQPRLSLFGRRGVVSILVRYSPMVMRKGNRSFFALSLCLFSLVCI